MKNYILNEDGEPVVCSITEYYRWQRALPKATQTGIGFTLRSDEIGDNHISTVYLGCDHGYGRGKPILWETMVFHKGTDIFCDRYDSTADAITGHDRICEKIRRGESLE